MANLELINNLLANQNKLLEQTNILMARQNQILQQQFSSTAPPREVFINDIEHDEMRSGFLVRSHRKKLWNVQIGLINEFARVCKKYNLSWFAFGGTLLGAARHKGFIPWDDDVDISMLRPDYNKFLEVADKEISCPYFVDNWFQYRFESDSEYDDSGNFFFITREQENRPFIGAFPKTDFFKIRDSRTTQIELNDRKNMNQGIWIDIFPFDNVPPFTDNKQAINFEIAREMIFAISHTDIIRDALKNNNKFLLKKEEFEKFLQLPLRHRVAQYNDFLGKNFFNSLKVGRMLSYRFPNEKQFNFDSKDFEKTVYLPFEKIELPAPAGWENCLTAQYGDWRKMVFTHTHSQDYSVDIPYTEYYKTSAFMK